MKKMIVTFEGSTIDYFPSPEIRAAREETILEICKKLPREGKWRQTVKRKEKHGPVVKWTDEEIRQKYGIRAKPFPHLRDNILWVIQNQGPVSSADIAEILGVPVTSISTTMTQIRKRFAPLVEVHEGRPMKLSFSINIPIEDWRIIFKNNCLQLIRSMIC